MWVAAAIVGAAIAAIAACTTGSPQHASALDRPDYNWDVRPILSQNCFACHGNDRPKAGLRLDIAERAYGELPETPGKHAIVRGKPERSELIRRITSSDVDVRMPPKETHKTLSDNDIAILTRWIEQGAEYKQHWAYIEPHAAPLPSTPWNDRAANPIDRFIFAKVADAGLTPAPEADRETLINRVSLDLTGLPPTLAEVDAFVADKRPDAYEKLVDRLLGSRHYAERQTNIWLDVARYADSDGFQFDGTEIFQFPYRDWVIAAFQNNMPYDRFVTWQLAGDKLANPTREQLTATAFGRAGKRSSEAGIIDEEYRVEYAAERAELVGKAFLGLTVGCAKCHDHKYDVISQADYYSMFAFFNQMNERGISSPGYFNPTGPTLAVPSPQQAQALAAADSTTAEKVRAYRAALQNARDAAAPAAARIAAQPAERVAFLQQASTANLQAYYPLDEMVRGDLTPMKRGRDGRPLALANAPRAAQPERGFGRIGQGTGGSKVFAAMRQMDPGLPRLAGEDLALAAEEMPPFEFTAFAPPPYEGPTLPGPLDATKLLLTPSGMPKGKPAAMQGAKLISGVHGSGAELSGALGVAYPGVGMFERTDAFSLDLWIRPRAEKPYDQAVLIQNRSGDSGPGYELHLQDNRPIFRFVHNEPYNSLAVIAKSPVPSGRWSHITVTYDGSSRAAGVALYVDGQRVAAEVEQDQLTRTGLPGAFSLGLVWGHLERAGDFKDGALDEIKVFTRALTPIEVLLGHDRSLADQARPEEIEAGIVDVMAARSPAAIHARTELTTAVLAEQEIEAPIHQLPVMKDRPLYRKTYVLDRGLYNSPKLTAEVQPQALSRVFAWSKNYRRDRLGLAQWLFDAKNPLTARVFVNRMWQARFGTGIVETIEDFGSQGSNPSHPELLDWLALEFQRSGWDIKHMHKLMVMSATYRQSSNLTDLLIEKDPRNLLLARGPRFRMPAEIIRDNALFAAGLLVDQAGGDAVFPYQPQGVWDFIGVPAIPYPQTVPADQNHRRSMYTFIRRNAAYPSLTVFDMPDRNVSTVGRRTSNTPLQALVLLNDVQYVEAYRKLAERAIKAGDGDQQLVTLFRLATRRHPAPAEVTVLRSYLASEMHTFQASPQTADKLLSTGVTPLDSSLDKTALAAMTMVTAAVMNTPDAYSVR